MRKTHYSHKLNINIILADVRRRTAPKGDGARLGLADVAFKRLQDRKNGSKHTLKRRRYQHD